MEAFLKDQVKAALNVDNVRNAIFLAERLVEVRASDVSTCGATDALNVKNDVLLRRQTRYSWPSATRDIDKTTEPSTF